MIITEKKIMMIMGIAIIVVAAGWSNIVFPVRLYLIIIGLTLFFIEEIRLGKDADKNAPFLKFKNW